jgi:hypothetical protein
MGTPVSELVPEPRAAGADYRHVLERPVVGDLGIVRARRSLHVPVVLTPEEVRRVLAAMSGGGRTSSWPGSLREGIAVVRRLGTAARELREQPVHLSGRRIRLGVSRGSCHG